MFDSHVPALVSLKVEKDELDRTTHVKVSKCGWISYKLILYVPSKLYIDIQCMCASKWITIN